MATQTQQVPQTQWDKELETLHRDSELLQEKIGLLQRLREIDLQRNGGAAAAVTAQAPTVAQVPTQAQAPAPKKKGRPKQVKAGVPAGDGKTVDLPTLLETIGQQVNKPLTLADFVTMVRQAGYETKAKDFSNMVYQALLKLCKRGKFKKNDETRSYEYIGNKAA